MNHLKSCKFKTNTYKNLKVCKCVQSKAKAQHNAKEFSNLQKSKQLYRSIQNLLKYFKVLQILQSMHNYSRCAKFNIKQI